MSEKKSLCFWCDEKVTCDKRGVAVLSCTAFKNKNLITLSDSEFEKGYRLGYRQGFTDGYKTRGEEWL